MGGIVTNQFLGVGQNYSDKSGSRSNGVTYYNTSSKPMFLFIMFSQSGGMGSSATLVINAQYAANASLQILNASCQLCGIVPPNGSYVTSGTFGPQSWFELT